MRSSIIRVWQREQRGRSIALKKYWVEDMVLPCFGRERYRTLSHRWLPMVGGDGTVMPPARCRDMVNIAHSPKFQELNQPPDWRPGWPRPPERPWLVHFF